MIRLMMLVMMLIRDIKLVLVIDLLSSLIIIYWNWLWICWWLL